MPSAQPAPAPAAAARLRLAGLLGERLDRALARLSRHPYSPVFVRSDVSFEMPRIFNEYSGDISGRWLEAISLARELGHDAPDPTPLAESVLACQRAGGWFGAEVFDVAKLSDRETKMLWGNGRLLVGLLTWHRASGDARGLAAATRLGEFLLACGLHRSGAAAGSSVAADGGAAGFATTFYSCIDGVVALWKATGDARFRDLAAAMAAMLPTALDGFHSHGRVLALRGVLDLAETTGDAALRARVVRDWEAIEAGHVTPLGGLREHFGHGCWRDEGCSIADWTMLSLALGAATGEERFFAAAEFALWNHLLANQTANGGFGHQLLLLDQPDGAKEPVAVGLGVQAWRPKQEGHKEAYWCCSFHGPRALLEVERVAARRADDGVELLVPTAGAVDCGPLRLRIDADAGLATLTITVIAAPSAPLALRVRVPAWAREATADVGDAVVAARAGRLEVKRAWRAGDRVAIALHPALTVRAARDAQAHPTDRESVFFGPLLLGYDGSDDLLWGQGLDGGRTTTTLILDTAAASAQRLPRAVLVEYHDRGKGRTIWASRRLVPLHERAPDHPLRTVHAVARRDAAELTAAQKADLELWRAQS